MNDKKITAMDVANYIVAYVNDNTKDLSKYSLTPLKLQKILYYVAVEYFKKTGNRLFAENFHKWQYGPVVKEVYYEFKSAGLHHISQPKMIVEISADYQISRKHFNIDDFKKLDNQLITVADKVIAHYMPWKAFDLVERTHDEAAWKNFESDIMKGIELTYSDEELKLAKSTSEK